MDQQTSLIITSIAEPNRILKAIATGCRERGVRLFLIGDEPSPPDFALEGCEFYSIGRQLATGFAFAEACPKRHYSRKNIGYLLAMQAGSAVIIETDDDNEPRPEFWQPKQRRLAARRVDRAGWVNVYRYFTDVHIWPRGLPLDAVQKPAPPLAQIPEREVDAPIQQGLADGNPDVDAIYRLVLPLPVRFARDTRAALGIGSWCPFNSQNTAWWPDAYPMLYLPSYCSFRMTDIWRSFVAQRIAWTNGWSVLFESPTVFQERNEHSLLRDFQDEIPGYLHNRKIAEKLESLPLRAGEAGIADNLRTCYEALVREGVVESAELPLLDRWLADIQRLRP